MTKTQAAALLVLAALCQSPGGTQSKPPAPLSPIAMAAAPGGKSIWIACATGRQLLEFDPVSLRVARRLALPGAPTGIAVARDGARLYVTCAGPESQVAVVDPQAWQVTGTIPAGHTATAPVLSPDGKRLYVANRFNHDIGVIDLESRRLLRRVPVEREPVAAAVTNDGRFLLVANHLHNGRADRDHVAASVSVVDLAAGRVAKNLPLPNGSGSLLDVRISPDGRHAAVSHVLGRHNVPTTQLERGWMNTNAVTLIDVNRLAVLATVLLDGPFNGAANPWGLAWTADGKRLLATHAGAHEVSITDIPGLLAKLATVPAVLAPGKTLTTVAASEVRADLPNDLSFLTGLRETVRLRETDRGPRSVVAIGNKAYASNYFSDTLVVIDLDAPARPPQSVALGPKPQPDLVRRGEEHFHDASLCFQRWQSCASCHPGEGRTDALAWDLLNDGIGNPKKTRSMVLSHATPPAMSTGVRDSAETAVRSGFTHIQFTNPPGSVTAAVDAYLRSLKPVPSPRLVKGQLSEAGRRGREIFFSSQAACSTCHPEGLFTDMQSYDVGTVGPSDKPTDKFDTPTLVEAWRTGPYLHDGSAQTMKDVLTVRNKGNRHGRTSHLTPRQLNDLIEYLLSL